MFKLYTYGMKIMRNVDVSKSNNLYKNGIYHINAHSCKDL